MKVLNRLLAILGMTTMSFMPAFGIDITPIGSSYCSVEQQIPQSGGYVDVSLTFTSSSTFVINFQDIGQPSWITQCSCVAGGKIYTSGYTSGRYFLSVSANQTVTLAIMASANTSTSSREWTWELFPVRITFKQPAPPKTYEVKYLKGTYGTGTESCAIKTEGVSLVLPSTRMFTRSNYTQEGWSFSTYGTSKAYSLGDSYTTDAATTLYPYWKGVTSTVTLNKQGGTGGSSSVTATYGSTMPTITVPTLSGYVFDGYYTDTNGSGTKYYNANGSSAHTCDFTSAKTLYAKWIQHDPTSYGLFVGVNEYTYANSLGGCIADATSMRMICTDYGDWKSENTLVLTNATLARFREEVSNLAAKAVAGDTVIIYDSGHGGAATTESKDTWICAYDDRYYDYTFASDIAEFDSGVKLIVVLDTCRSAGMFKATDKGVNFTSKPSASNFIANVSSFLDNVKTKSVVDKGTIDSSEIGWLAAADYNVNSSDLGSMGLMTGLMIVDGGVLNGLGDLNEDGKITFSELYQYAVDFSSQNGFAQVAQAANESVLDSVSLSCKHFAVEEASDCEGIELATGSLEGISHWVGQNISKYAHAGDGVIRSILLPDDFYAIMNGTVTGPGELRFWWKVSSQYDCDGVGFFVDEEYHSELSGESDWEEVAVEVGDGEHTFQWQYVKDDSITEGYDCAWLDQITWTPTATYQIKYMPGANGTGSSFSDTKMSGLALDLRTAIFTRTGYTQTGWATSDGGAQAYALGASYTANAAVTLYPVWTPNTYKVQFVANGGTGTMSDQTHTYDSPLALTANQFTNDGYSFVGWALHSATDSVDFEDGELVMNLTTENNAIVNLYAVWDVASVPLTNAEMQEALDCDLVDFKLDVSDGAPYWTAIEGDGFIGGSALTVQDSPTNQWSSVITTVTGPCVVGWDWICITNGSRCALYLYYDGKAKTGVNDGSWHTHYWEVDSGSHTLDWCFHQGALNSDNEGGGAALEAIDLYYQVSCEGDDADGSVMMPSGFVYKDNDDGTTNYYYSVGSEFTLPSSDGLTKAGRVFSGWLLEGTSDVYQPGDVYVVDMTPAVFIARWGIAQTVVKIEKPTVVQGLTYTAESQQGFSDIDTRVLISGTTAAIDAGEYSATFTLPADTANEAFKWTDESVDPVVLNWSIAQRNVNDASVTFESISDQAYTGSAIEPAVIMTYAGVVCSCGMDYTKEYSNNTDVGTATITINGCGNFIGSKKLNFNIVSSNPDPDPYPAPSWVAPNDKENWQCVYAKVYDTISSAYLTHADALLAAFDSEGNCIGVASLNSKLSFFMLNVGFDGSKIENITLKYWDSTRGEITIPGTITMTNGQDVGEITAPEVFEVGATEMEITLNQNYTWISIPLVLDDSSIESVFADGDFSTGDKIAAPGGSATYMAGEWYCSPESFSVVPGVTYVVRKSAAGSSVLHVAGSAMEPNATVVAGWNWLGSMSTCDVDISTLTHSGGFVDKDKVSGQGSGNTAAYMADEWYGMETLKAGVGYKVKLANAGTISVGSAANNQLTVQLSAKSMMTLSNALKDDPSWSAPNNKENWQCVYAKVRDVSTLNYYTTAGARLAAFDVGGNCIGVATINSKLSIFMLNVGFDGASISDVSLKYWDTDRGVVDIDGVLTLEANEDIGSIVSPIDYMTKVNNPIPALPDNPSASDVHEALEGSADAALQEHITEPAVYDAYRAWAESVKDTGGAAIAGQQAVKDSPHAWLSFALGSESLIAEAPAEGDIKIDNFEPSETSGKYDFEVSIEDVTVGNGATEENIKKVFGIEGSTALGDDTKPFSAENVGITLAEPKDGKIKFTAGPTDTTATSFFMKVKMK